MATVLASLHFWRNHGPSQPNSFFDRLETDVQDVLDRLRTGSSRLDPLTVPEIDQLIERLNRINSLTEPCECELPGAFCSGVPGILAHIENGRLAPQSNVERCDLCQRYPSDEAALQKLVELGMA